jgi:hypothetical protein
VNFVQGCSFGNVTGKISLGMALELSASALRLTFACRLFLEWQLSVISVFISASMLWMNPFLMCGLLWLFLGRPMDRVPGGRGIQKAGG